MREKAGFELRTKTLLVVFGLCAFLAVFAAVDTAEYYRAWGQARNWTDVQKSVAPAVDAMRMYALILAALVLDTAVIALSFAGGLALGISTATESRLASRVTYFLCVASVLSGLCFAIVMSFYRVNLGARMVLKGPVFDYTMRIQPPVALAMAAFPVLTVFLPFIRGKRPLKGRRAGQFHTETG